LTGLQYLAPLKAFSRQVQYSKVQSHAVPNNPKPLPIKNPNTNSNQVYKQLERLDLKTLRKKP
jgi:hypothetical protein